MTSYSIFFNVDTTDCEKSTFHYWWAGYDPPSDRPIDRIVYLTRDLRKELDDLVYQLNGVIEDAVHLANIQLGTNQVHYVEVNPAFDTHRWCEEGDWHEPDPNVPSTWFFLSGWPDVSIEGSAADNESIAAEGDEISSLIESGPINLPNAEN